MAKKSSADWENRFELLEQLQNRQGKQACAEVEKQYRKAREVLEGQILSWYQQSGDNNGVSLRDAHKMLTGREMKVFKREADEYIRYAGANSGTETWMKQLENASARYQVTRLDALKLQTRQTLEVMFDHQLSTIGRTMENVYRDGYYRTAYEIQKGIGAGWSIAALDQEQISGIINTPWAADGKHFTERIWLSRQKLVNELHTELIQNMILGQEPQKILDYIAKKMNTSKNNARRLIMTEQAFFHSTAQKNGFDALGVDKYKVVVTLDSRTSDICREMDGKGRSKTEPYFLISEWEAGITAPPFHVWCRTTTAPYLDDNDDVNESSIAGESTDQTSHLPVDMTFEEWEQSFVAGEKENLQSHLKDDKISNKWAGLDYQHSYTKLEAIKRLKDEYRITFRDLKDKPMDESLLSDCVGWLDSFSRQYPNFMQRNPCKIPEIKVKLSKQIEGNMGEYNYKVKYAGVIDLVLNAEYHSDTALFQQYVNDAVKSKWYPANSTIHKTFVHEYGHHVSNSMRWITKNSDWEELFIKECLKEYTGEEEINFKVVAVEVSNYAATAQNEFFAESFAEYFGGEEPRPFAQFFGQKLEKLLKEVK